MRRESAFEDDGYDRQDRQQKNHAHEVHGISTHSLRSTTHPRDLPDPGPWPLKKTVVR